MSGSARLTVFTPLPAGRSYQIYMRALNLHGEGPMSAVRQAKTPTTTPSAPSDVVSTAGSASATVSWNAPASTGGSAITEYTAIATPGSKACGTTTTRLCTITGLANGIKYTVTVRAKNAVGFSPASSASLSVTPSPTAARALLWSDEFAKPGLDGGKWSHRNPGSEPRRAGFNTPSAISVAGDGYLRLTSSVSNGRLETGMIGTQGKFERAFGYFEARIRFQREPGHHGAFWLQASPGDGSGSEIDVAEYFGARSNLRDFMQAVYPTGSTNIGVLDPSSSVRFFPDLGGILSPGAALHDSFHIFGVEWTSTGYRFFVDGKLTGSMSRGLAERKGYIVLSLISSDWENPELDVRRLPDAMVVDWVRVYSSRT
jgi:beta-glucanase (GH16 family)